MLQVIFHGVDRSPAAEADITDRFEALKRFDNSMTDCKATITKVGHQGLGEFSVKLDIVVGGGRTVVASENDPDAMCAITANLVASFAITAPSSETSFECWPNSGSIDVSHPM